MDTTTFAAAPAGQSLAARLAVGLLAVVLAATSIGYLASLQPARAQPAALTPEQADAQRKYDDALKEFKAVLAQRRAQIDAKQSLPNLPGQAIYLARLKRDEHLQGSHRRAAVAHRAAEQVQRASRLLRRRHRAADRGVRGALPRSCRRRRKARRPRPRRSRTSPTSAGAIGRAKGLDAAAADAAARISLGIFFAETNGNQNIGNARSNTYKGSLQTGTSEDRKGRRKWAALKPKIAAVDPAVAARDDKEEARIGKGDQRYNHWTAVRNGLMNAHADLFAQLPEIMRMLPDEIDQMKFFQLIQIIPSPTRSAFNSGNFEGYRISDARIMGYLRNNSIFTFGKKDRAKTSATFREILDAMWLFDSKFEKARAKFAEVAAQ